MILKIKCVKERTAKKYITGFEYFLESLRFDFLQPKEDDNFLTPLIIFPNSIRYNIYQVYLPFVNGKYVTFTIGEDDDVNAKCLKGYFRKSQFTVHPVVNSGEGEYGMAGVDFSEKLWVIRLMEQINSSVQCIK